MLDLEAVGEGKGPVRGQRSSASPPLVKPPARAPASSAALGLLRAARNGLVEAAALEHASDRYATAHLAALRAAAAVLAARARPADAARRHRVRSTWAVLPEVAPELADWAAFFATGAPKRAAAEAGLPHAASAREASDLMRDAETFLTLIEAMLGLPHQSSLPYPSARAS